MLRDDEGELQGARWPARHNIQRMMIRVTPDNRPPAGFDVRHLREHLEPRQRGLRQLLAHAEIRSKVVSW